MPHKAFALQISQNLGWDKFALLIASHKARPFAKNPYALQPHKDTIVLPDFTRSCSADGIS
ncbi:MAG: hypothetical protein ABIN95_07250 [Mucilaginibacter sp.]